MTDPAAPPPEGLAAALKMVDAATETLGARSFYVVQGDAWLTAVFAVARATVDYDAAVAAYMDPSGPLCGEALADLHAAIDRTHGAKTAAVARLCALATGAQAGEGGS